MNKTSKVITIPPKNPGAVWAERAQFRAQNRKWLGYSGKIALRIMSAMEEIPNMTQKSLAVLAEVSPQHINKIMKGQENLTLKTIAKFSEILKIELISFPSFKYNHSFNIMFDVNSNGGVIVASFENRMINDRYEPMEFSIQTGSHELNRVRLTLTP